MERDFHISPEIESFLFLPKFYDLFIILDFIDLQCEGSMEQKASNEPTTIFFGQFSPQFPNFLEELHLKIITYDSLLVR